MSRMNSEWFTQEENICIEMFSALYSVGLEIILCRRGTSQGGLSSDEISEFLPPMPALSSLSLVTWSFPTACHRSCSSPAALQQKLETLTEIGSLLKGFLKGFFQQMTGLELRRKQIFLLVF